MHNHSSPHALSHIVSNYTMFIYEVYMCTQSICMIVYLLYLENFHNPFLERTKMPLHHMYDNLLLACIVVQHTSTNTLMSNIDQILKMTKIPLRYTC